MRNEAYINARIEEDLESWISEYRNIQNGLSVIESIYGEDISNPEGRTPANTVDRFFEEVGQEKTKQIIDIIIKVNL